LKNRLRAWLDFETLLTGGWPSTLLEMKMRKARVVIGANFGDEGKGLMTDYFTSGISGYSGYSSDDTVVIRFNGGAQAGHTVINNGRRHVFHHFGSGTLSGASTFLSRYFIVNPILFRKEYDELKRFGIEPVVFADLNCRVTTPLDMMINQILEDSRGDKRHGSCGIGIHETVKRDEVYPLRVKDLFNSKNVGRCCEFFRKSYINFRLDELGVTDSKFEKRFSKYLDSKEIIKRYLDDVDFFMDSVNKTEVAITNVIFEGAQGLLLDQDHEFFPHVTCSKTGLHNVRILAKEFGIDFLDVTYVTRCYTTRHGAGPFPNEISDLPYHLVKDDTNQYNTYQGKLRFGWLDLDLLAKTISSDTAGGKNEEISLAITCLDQIPIMEKISAIKSGKLRSFGTANILSHVGVKCGYASLGPSSLDVYTV